MIKSQNLQKRQNLNTKNSEILKIKDNNTLFFALPNFLQ